ncbi:uncharacterized protein K489DRAFT_64935 [Dissoconium aciculare CBS 342.82]|uniref:Uncharacterized protein n=1 Tax=Dissoconium aciculare CBS 342.82 TaxID=1314786 RepID=A0A6J3LVR8_9PEZI|nr:uncharacterized protein K489DRAFT_64935 [Dissoconium aciculare CBS 342.82]KAF1819374.1 hypothetical protein K489DRAFT_64935 [Dissoconium aciculare CBS 342.82]
MSCAARGPRGGESIAAVVQVCVASKSLAFVWRETDCTGAIYPGASDATIVSLTLPARGREGGGLSVTFVYSRAWHGTSSQPASAACIAGDGSHRIEFLLQQT